MIRSILYQFFKTGAAPVVLLRGMIVAGNFAVMIGLAAILGLDTFGRLAVIWGVALVAGTVMSVGAPLLLLRGLTDGGGLSATTVLRQVVFYPAILGILALFVLSSLFPALPWITILAAGFCINALTCAASVMRAFGSIQVSMVLRDAAPQLILGVAALTSGDAVSILNVASVWMAALCGFAGLWCLFHPKRVTQIQTAGKTIGVDASLWGTSVLGMVLAQIDIIIGGGLMSDGQIGLYALLRRIANLVALPVTVATWVTSAPVSEAYGRDDQAALQRASTKGSRIAISAGLILFAGALLLLPVLSTLARDTWQVEGHLIYLIFLIGALVQVCFASSFTVATLSGLAHYAAFARLFSIVFYIAAVAFVAPDLALTINALSYVTAIGVGNLLLWQVVQRHLGLDTSALAVLRKGEGRWKLS